MLEKLIVLYGEVKGKETEGRIKKLIDETKAKINCGQIRKYWDEKDIFLITYPDTFSESNVQTLHTLNKFLKLHLQDLINGIHILPFFPFSSDRGFSVSDFYQVKQEFGTWQNIEEIAKNYRLMVDLVLNHISVKHIWFQKFLTGDEKYWDYFIHFGKDEIPHSELKKVFRPRNSPLLTRFDTTIGERWVWTTFSVQSSTDQVDLNYRNPQVLIEIIKILLFLLEIGVRVLRLDSIPYLWKEVGTNCKNLKQTHLIVNMFRSILDEVCPSALLISQASTSFSENISYFGNAQKESHLVYNFPLPLLVLDAFYNQNNKYLNQLVEKMQTPNHKCTYFNMLAVHDGIGISGAKGFLTGAELEKVYLKIENKAGQLSFRRLSDGTETVSELNTTWWSALADDSESFEIKLKKFITSYAIAIALSGIPAVYYLSLFGGKNDFTLFEKTKIKRDLNRTNLNLTELEAKLKDDSGYESKVFSAMTGLIRKRIGIKAFHPNAKQELINLDKRIFSVLRGEGSDRIIALHNLSDREIKLKFENRDYLLEPFGYIWSPIS